MTPKQWQKQLEQLSGWRQFAFLLALAERAFPNFALFAEITHPVDGDRFRYGLDQGWSMLEQKNHNVDVFKLLARLESACPDPGAHDFYGVHPALDAWQLLEQALLCHVNPDRKRAADGAAMAMGTVVTFIEVTDGDGLDENELVRLLEKHELTDAEQGFQQALVERLRPRRAPDAELVEELRTMARNDGISNLGLEVPERWADGAANTEGEPE